MSAQPPGALVFTDIVGFTQFTEQQGDERALAVLDRQDAIVRAHLPTDARVVKELGDGLFLWFADPCAAVTTCLTLQEQFAAEAGRDLPLWVRMGVHWGSPRRRGDDLIGHDVNLTARIAAIAGAGELVVSQMLVEAADLRAVDVDLHELGPVFVRGVAAPVPLYRLVRT
ncbi:MAG TPA: adenylate/guanylate cyclase domain-containing protein [Acidimicrobiia bacterium]|nr:adenylate/guanylate cyclase domain-containing protein [Acidimicrobiia bacterium]